MHVRAFAPDEVTSRNTQAEVDPLSVGLTRQAVDVIWQAVVRLYETGLHPAIALCVRRHGQVVIDRAIGHLRGNAPGASLALPPTPIRHDSLFSLFSASKAVTAMVVHLLDERGLVHLDDAVAEYIPEFAAHGKHTITLRQLLTHRAGIPTIPRAGVDAELLSNWDAILELLCQAKPLSTPGRRLSYHALTAGYIFGEVVRRVVGSDIRACLRREVLDPLGFVTFEYGVGPERVTHVAEHALTGFPAVPPHSWLLERSLGVSLRRAVELSNHPAFLTSIVPSGNIIGTANEASRFFQLLLDGGELDGVRVLEPRTVRRAVAEQTYLEVDSFLGVPVRYGMGFMLGGEHLSLYGADTPNAYGHLGFTNVVAYADPDRALSVGLMTSGKPFITPGLITWLGVGRTIAKVCPKRARN